ncbi:MAG: hypothetical protein MZV64_73340 [Ignavibacteriales bacterium]|nr:hypothetical protein [Ignavibacteriales bacterium]
MPPDAGVRLVLVAGAARRRARRAGPRCRPLAPGDVVFAGDSRIQIEFDDDTLEVFYLFDLVNPSAAPVTPEARTGVRTARGRPGRRPCWRGRPPQATVRGRDREHHRADRARHHAGPAWPTRCAPAGPDRRHRAEAAGGVGPGAGHHDARRRGARCQLAAVRQRERDGRRAASRSSSAPAARSRPARRSRWR